MNDRPDHPSSLHSRMVWRRVWLFAFLVSWGPLGYAATMVLGLGGSSTFLTWTLFWGLPWSLLPVADTPYVSIHVDQLWVTLCALLNVALVVGIGRYAIAHRARQQHNVPHDREPAQ